MRKKHLVTVMAVASMFAVGCASVRETVTGNPRSSTPAAPSGPIQASTTNKDTVPAGTTLSIRTNEQIRTAEAGGRYSGTVEQDVVNSNYDVLIPKGSRAELVVIDATQGGVAGTKSVALAVNSITVNGKTLTVSSSGSEQRAREGLGKNDRTATMVGGGAVLGTVIGAVAGGASGAAIGAAVGAAGGAATQVLTRGKEVEVPAETVLSFQLQQPLQLRG